MTDQSQTERRVPALLTTAGNFIGTYWKEIAGVTGTFGGIVTILDTVFGVSLAPYGSTVVELFTSDGIVTILLLIILISQVLVYQRIEWIVNQLESAKQDEVNNETPKDEADHEKDEMVTDGGSSNTQPRDSKGRFTTSDSGRSNVFLIILAAITGYLVGAETGVIDPYAAALIAIALLALIQSDSG